MHAPPQCNGGDERASTGDGMAWTQAESGHSADVSDIRAAGVRLREVAAGSATARRYGPLRGAGEAAAVEAAAARFRTSWTARLGEWERTVGALGEGVTVIAATMAEQDRQAAEPWRVLAARVPR